MFLDELMQSSKQLSLTQFQEQYHSPALIFSPMADEECLNIDTPDSKAHKLPEDELFSKTDQQGFSSKSALALFISSVDDSFETALDLAPAIPILKTAYSVPCIVFFVHKFF